MSLSTRGARAQEPGLSYWAFFAAALKDPFSASNPGGAIAMCVAENGLSAPVVAARLPACRTPLPHALKYDDMRGRHSLRAAFAALAERTITRGARVAPEHLTVAAGCGALIQALAFLLLDAKDAVLLPTPTYGALYNDFCVLANTNIIDVPRASDGVAPLPANAADFDAAAARAESAGLRVKMLFLINPCNPTGAVLPADAVREGIAWARARGDVHVVVDEIYALSVWGDAGAGAPFVSAVELCAPDGGLGDFVHVLWGFSKDFCASGLRTGLLLSHNKALLAALDNVGYFTTVSNDTQDTLASLISDSAWIDSFIASNHAALREAHAAVAASLARLRLPVAPATSGMFVWVSLAELLSEPSWAAERALTNDLFADAKLVFTPGEAMHAATPGKYRICYAWGSADALREALLRLERFVNARRASRAGAVRASASVTEVADDAS